MAECAPPLDSDLVQPEDWIPSPNFEPRRGEGGVDMLLLHYTATPTTDYALELLTSASSGVSSHYLIDGEGRIIQMVAEQHRAWHAGEAVWAGASDINSCSIGIEIQNEGAALARLPAYGKRQMQAVIALCRDIIKRHRIPAERVLGHSDVAPHRKQDPGAHFDWQALHAAGVGLWLEGASDPPMAADVAAPMPQRGEILDIQEQLCAIGYGLDLSGELDERTRLVIAAFQRHYRPLRVDGELDRQTVQLIAALKAKIKA